MSENIDPRFTVAKDGWKFYVTDTFTGERLDGFKTKRQAEAEADSMQAEVDAMHEQVANAAQDEAVGETPQPDPANVAAMVDHLETATAAVSAAVSAELTNEDVAAMATTERIILAKAEAAATQKWLKAGAEGDAPPRPVLDWMATGTVRTRKPRTASTRQPKVVVPDEMMPQVRTMVEAMRADGKSWKEIATASANGPCVLTENQAYTLANRGGWAGASGRVARTKAS